MTNSEQSPACVDPEPDRILEFETSRSMPAGARLRLTCSHSLQFDKVPRELSLDQNAARSSVVVVLPQCATAETDPPQAQFQCRDFLSLQDLYAFYRWLRVVFERYCKHSTSELQDQEFHLVGSNRAVELRFRAGTVRGKFQMTVLGRIAGPPLQRRDWESQWKWVTEFTTEDFAFASEFGFLVDPECLRVAGHQLGAFLRVYAPVDE